MEVRKGPGVCTLQFILYINYSGMVCCSDNTKLQERCVHLRLCSWEARLEQDDLPASFVVSPERGPNWQAWQAQPGAATPHCCCMTHSQLETFPDKGFAKTKRKTAN